MSEALARIRRLIAGGQWRISAHAMRELSTDGIVIEAIVLEIETAIVVEDYPNYHKGPSVLVLQRDEFGLPIHLLWGIPLGIDGPAVLVTAYRPDPLLWSLDFIKRRSQE